MHKSIKNITTILMLSIVIYANNAIAKSCYEASPNLTNQDKEYFDLEETKTLSNQERKKLNDFFRVITGKWKGGSINIECKGPDSAPRKTIKKATITAKSILASNGNLIITARKNYIKRENKQKG